MPQIIFVKAQILMLLSFLMTFAVVINAFYIKKQFYPSVVYLTKSSTSVAVLYVQALVCIILFGKLVQRIFLGQLRTIETEHLYDRTWFSVTETCLAFTVFRDDFSARFVTLFAILLFLKCFHWLLDDRVDYMEQSPVINSVFHARTISLATVLLLLDYLFIIAAYKHTIAQGASAQIVFGFEYSILLVSIILTAVKYILHTIEIRTGEQWESKGVCMLYSDLIFGFFRVVLYILFMIVMMKIHTFPLFSIRPMFVAIRAFHKCCYDIIESRRAINSLNTMYPDVTADELANVADTTCIICREDMQTQQSIKRLGCQHVFHKRCLCSWFQRQQSCPICRTTVLRPTATGASNVAAAAAAPAGGGGAPPTSPSSQQQQQSNSQTTNTTGVQASPFNIVPPSSSSSTTTAESAAMPQFQFNAFPMVLPPFACPPPPLPPINFSDMSEEAIRAMEGIELAHVQARIQCLRNIRTMLDVSIIQMEQYANIVSTQSDTDNSARSSKNIRDDLNQVTTTSEDLLVDENNLDLIRRRRLEHLAPRMTSSTSTGTQNDKSDNDTQEK